MSTISNINAVILCGGKGIRLQSLVSDRAKPMALIGSKPFLDILIDYLADFAVSNVLLCCGFMAESITKYYRRNSKGMQISFSIEEKPLGTAGALKLAESRIKSNPFLVLNGDSICRVDLKDMLAFHLKHKASVTISLTKIENVRDFGSVEIDEKNKIKRFLEKKSSSAPGLINAGIYLFNREVLSMIPKNKKYSSEYDLFPQVKDCYGYVTNSCLTDIGTKERYMKAQKTLKIKEKV